MSIQQNENWKQAFLDFSKGTLSSSDPSFEIHLEDGVIAIGEILLLDIASYMHFQVWRFWLAEILENNGLSVVLKTSLNTR